jgi:hypothetical protein
VKLANWKLDVYNGERRRRKEVRVNENLDEFTEPMQAASELGKRVMSLDSYFSVRLSGMDPASNVPTVLSRQVEVMPAM